jgi:hypothetical protein
MAVYEPPNLASFTERGPAGRISHAITVEPQAEALNPPTPVPEALADLELLFEFTDFHFFFLFFLRPPDGQLPPITESRPSVGPMVMILTRALCYFVAETRLSFEQAVGPAMKTLLSTAIRVARMFPRATPEELIPKMYMKSVKTHIGGVYCFGGINHRVFLSIRVPSAHNPFL